MIKNNIKKILLYLFSLISSVLTGIVIFMTSDTVILIIGGLASFLISAVGFFAFASDD